MIIEKNQKVLRNFNIPFLYHKEAYRAISVVKIAPFDVFPKSIFTKLFPRKRVDCVKCEIFNSIWTVIKVCQPSLIYNIQFIIRWVFYLFLETSFSTSFKTAAHWCPAYRDIQRWPEIDCEVTWHQIWTGHSTWLHYNESSLNIEKTNRNEDPSADTTLTLSNLMTSPKQSF